MGESNPQGPLEPRSASNRVPSPVGLTFQSDGPRSFGRVESAQGGIRTRNLQVLSLAPASSWATWAVGLRAVEGTTRRAFSAIGGIRTRNLRPLMPAPASSWATIARPPRSSPDDDLRCGINILQNIAPRGLTLTRGPRPKGLDLWASVSGSGGTRTPSAVARPARFRIGFLIQPDRFQVGLLAHGACPGALASGGGGIRTPSAVILVLPVLRQRLGERGQVFSPDLPFVNQSVTVRADVRQVVVMVAVLNLSTMNMMNVTYAIIPTTSGARQSKPGQDLPLGSF